MNTNEHRYLNQLSEQVIGAAFEVSNELGVGFLEKVYEKALLHELRLRGMQVTAQQRIEVNYKNECVGEYVADIVVDNRLIVELKCVDAIALEHVAQCLNYLKATGLRLALLLNFRKSKVEIKRVVL